MRPLYENCPIGNGQDQAYQTKYQPEATVVPPARKGDGISLPEFSGSKSLLLVVIYKFDPLNLKNGVQISPSAYPYVSFVLELMLFVDFSSMYDIIS